MSDVRTRFAPSPTGALHVGNARTAIFNWLFARHCGGTFILRLEDTDVERNVAGAEAAILRDLRWLGLEWDEGPEADGDRGPYRQSERLPLYRERAEALRDAGVAYPCYCPPGEERQGAGCPCDGLSDGEAKTLRGERGAPALRLRVPEREVVVTDEIRGSISFHTRDFGDFIILRGDGRPTYNFAVVADDAAMAVTDVIRGVGHLSNTPKQLLLYEALDEEPPRFAHLPTVLATDRSRLSKRTGARALEEYRADGIPPGALVNHLSLLGWSHPREREFLTREELVEAVDLRRVGSADTVFDPEKLAWLSSRHIQEMDADALARGLAAHLDGERYPLDDAALPAVADALRERLDTFADVNRVLEPFFPPEEALRPAREALAGDPEATDVLRAVRETLGELEEWGVESTDAAVREGGRRAGVRGAALFKPVRRALTGEPTGPDLGTLLAVIGREEALRRLAAVEAETTV